MKQLLFLLLSPCFALAQYPGNANQKLTLGEQTTADGLVYRGLASDTTRKPSVDTMAYILLDTNTNIIWQYKKATNNAWTRVGGSISSGLTGVLPVANGGTGQSTLAAAGIVTGTGTTNYLPKFTGTSTIGNSLVYDNGTSLGINNISPQSFSDGRVRTIDGKGTDGFLFIGKGTNTQLRVGADDAIGGIINVIGSYSLSTFVNGAERMRITSDGNVCIGTESPSEKLHVVGNGRFTAVGAGTFANNLNITSDGTLTTSTSDEKYKYNILPINYGLNTILQLKPVNFQWIEGEEQDLGFIAQDVADIIPEAVDTNWNSDLLMRYESIIPILTKAIQEQNALIKALEQRILILENK